jgi:Ca2+-binding RTX toxin-like protein
MISKYFVSAQFAQASYGNLTIGNSLADALTDQATSGFTATQAARFADKYSLVTQFNDDAVAGVGNRTGFSVSVFTESATNKLTVALRGTLGNADLVVTDGYIAFNGAAYDQIVAMQNWWRRETSAANQMVDQYEAQIFASGESIPNNAKLLTQSNAEGGTSLYLVKKASVAATGTLVAALAASGGTVDATGHSLGGHLAMAFQALNNAKTATVTTFNAPGFLNSNSNQQFFSELGGSVPTGTKTTNVIADGTSGNDVSFRAIAGLHGRPGTPIDVRIENQVGGAEPVKPDARNHSMTILTDALAVAETFIKVDPSFTLNKFSSLLDASSNQEYSSLEKLAGKLRNLFRGDSTELPAGNNEREKLYVALGQVQDDLLVLTNAGPQPPRTIRDLTTFTTGGIVGIAKDGAEALAYRYALKELNPFAIVNAPGLYDQHNQNGALTLSTPDNNNDSGQITEQWLIDRSAMFAEVIKLNQQDIDPQTGAVPSIGIPVQYEDRTKKLTFSTQILPSPSSPVPHARVIFGASVSEADINGSSRDDRLYGGAGNDTVSGGDGDDYLEGNADNDTLKGGKGKDELEGGQGDDTLIGGSGDDKLYGGKGSDSYRFEAGEGTDTIKDSDGLGSVYVSELQLDYANAAGQKNTWLTKDNKFTIKLISGDLTIGGKLEITGSGLGTGKVIIEEFKNQNLGINLETKIKTAIDKGVAKNNYQTADFNAAATQNTADAKEGGGKQIRIDLNQAAKAGDKVTIAASGDGSDKFSAVTGNDTIKFSNGPIEITLTEGQTQVYLAVVNDGDVDTDAAITFTSGYIATDGRDTTEAADTFVLNLDATDEADQAETTYNIKGDIRPTLGGPINSQFDQWGNVIAGGDPDPTWGDRLNGSPGNDNIEGLGGKDTLKGNDGNDLIDGGTGVNTLEGGNGNDTLFNVGTDDEQNRYGVGIGEAGDDIIFAGDKEDDLTLAAQRMMCGDTRRTQLKTLNTPFCEYLRAKMAESERQHCTLQNFRDPTASTLARASANDIEYARAA